jgi:hypothetical protein
MAPAESLAASILYGDMMGNDVTFLTVTETSDDPLPLYGPPNLVAPPAPVFPCVLANNCTVNGNSLTFSPQQFAAASSNQVPPNNTTDGQLTFMVEAKPGDVIQNILFEEGGAFTVGGFVGTNTDNTQVDVSTIGFVTVLAVDGIAINPVAIPIGLTFDFGVGGNGTWRFVTEGAANGKLWNGDQFINITQELMNHDPPINGRATKINVNLDNILFAQSELLGNAMIDKKLFFIVTVNIPEPASVSLLVIALAGAMCFARRLRK